MKIAKFRRPDSFYDTILEESELREGSVWQREYVQVTDWIEVEFQPVSSRDVVEATLKVLDNAETELRNKFEEKLGQINNEREKVRALTYDGAS